MSVFDILLILVVGLPVLVKLIGSSIEKAGKVPNIPQQMPDFPEDFFSTEDSVPRSPEESYGHDDYFEGEEQRRLTSPQTFESIEVGPSPSPVRPAYQPATPNLRSSDEVLEVVPSVKSVSKSRKIDKKNLVIYSEIMKPKYME